MPLAVVRSEYHNRPIRGHVLQHEACCADNEGICIFNVHTKGPSLQGASSNNLICLAQIIRADSRDTTRHRGYVTIKTPEIIQFVSKWRFPLSDITRKTRI